MTPFRWHLRVGLAVLLAAAPVMWAQPSAPHIAYIYPAGGRQGTTSQAKIGGQYLDGVTNVYVSGGGIQVAAAELTKPPAQKEINALRERLDELQKQPKDAAVQKEIADIRTRLLLFNISRGMSPALAETIAQSLLAHFPADAVVVRVIKQPPPIAGIVDSAGVEIRRERVKNK